MKLYNTEFNLVLDLISDMDLDSTFEVYGDITFNLTNNGSVVRSTIENNKLTIMTYGGGVYINEIDKLTYQLELKGVNTDIHLLKTFLWADMLYFNRITVNGKNINKPDFIINLLDNYLSFLRCKCLVVDVMIRERIVSINYFKGGRVQRTYVDKDTVKERPYMLIFDTNLKDMYKRHKSIRLVGVSPNRELAYPEAYYKQLARVCNMKHLGSKFKFKRAEGVGNNCLN